MRRSDGTEHVAWLPSQAAVVGWRLRIDGMGGTWQVMERYETWPADRVIAKEQDYKHQREASDV